MEDTIKLPRLLGPLPRPLPLGTPQPRPCCWGNVKGGHRPIVAGWLCYGPRAAADHALDYGVLAEGPGSMIYWTASLPSACVVTLFSNNATLRSGHISQIVGIILGWLTVGGSLMQWL